MKQIIAVLSQWGIHCTHDNVPPDFNMKTFSDQSHTLDIWLQSCIISTSNFYKSKKSFRMFSPLSEKKLVSQVPFIKYFQLITSEVFLRVERIKRHLKMQQLLWRQGSLIKQREKCLAPLLSVPCRQLGETERFMSNRMKKKAVGPGFVISYIFSTLDVSV